MGHPIVINKNLDYTLESCFGFVKCKALPPRDVYFPVLPLKVDGKLMFPLCTVSARERNTNGCNHTDNDRIMTNTWTTEELKIAIIQGYKIISILEALHYKTVTDSLFKKYINMWLKIKQQASGWPSWCQSEEQKQQFINSYKNEEGVELEF